MNRSLVPLVASLALVAAPVVPAHADDAAIVQPCRLMSDPKRLGSADIEYFHVVGGPVVVANTAVTSVTVTCYVLTDGWVSHTVSATQPGNVGFARGYAVVGTFTGPTIGICTVVSWTGGTGGGYDDCPFAG